jgi:hypothetical protein
MQQRFVNRAGAVDGPASHAFSIPPHDGNDLEDVTRGIYIGAAGSLVVVLASAAEVTFANLPSGSLLPVRATRVKATGTTAAQLVGLV